MSTYYAHSTLEIQKGIFKDSSLKYLTILQNENDFNT